MALGGEGEFLPVAVTKRPGLLHEVGGVRAAGPFVPVRADFTFDIEVVEQDELVRERVMIGSNICTEKAERWVCIAFPNVTKDLVERSIFLDDIDDVLNGGRVA